MSNNTRAIIVQPCENWPDGYIPVTSCFHCKMNDSHGYNSSNKKNKWICNILGEISCSHSRKAKEDKVPPLWGVYDSCPLPLLDSVRWHEMTQLPPSRKRVEVELEFARNATREIRTGLLVGNENTWAIDGVGLIYENETNIKLLRWRHIL